MTWKEFKESVEAVGVKDSDSLYYIDTGTFPEIGRLTITINVSEDGREVIISG